MKRLVIFLLYLTPFFAIAQSKDADVELVHLLTKDTTLRTREGTIGYNYTTHKYYFIRNGGAKSYLPGSSFSLSNGSGTTASGSAVNLGGTAAGDITIDMVGNAVSITGTSGGKTNTIGFSNGGGISFSSGGGASSELNMYVQNSGGASHVQLDMSPTLAILEGAAWELSGTALTIPTSNSLTSKTYVLGAKTYTGTQTFLTGTTSNASLIIPNGVAPTSPSNGQVWGASNHLFMRLNGVTQQLDQQSAGITNSAINNELMKSNGTNATPSGLFNTTLGDLNLGSTSISGNRTIVASNSGSNAQLNINASGGIQLTGAGGVNIGSATTGTRRLDLNEDDANNSIVSYPFRAIHTTSLTPSTGIATGVELVTETSASNNEVGSTIESITTDVTSTSEDFDLVFKTMAGGSTAAERLRINLNEIKISGDIKLANIGNGLIVKEGTNGSMNVATLTGGTVTVSNTKVTANSMIIVSIMTKGTITIPASYDTETRTPGVSFVINSSSAIDTSTVRWLIVEPN